MYVNCVFFGIGRFITNQQNIYRLTPVHYLQRQRKRHEKEQYNIEGEKRECQPL